MNKVVLFLIAMFVVSCAKREDMPETESYVPLSSRSTDYWELNVPSYVVTDSLYWFTLFTPGATKYHGYSWDSTPSTAYINGNDFGVYANFYIGGWYTLRFQFYDFSGNIYYLNDAHYVSVFEMNPSIAGTDKMERGTSYTCTVNYNNIVSNYTVEWDIPSNISYYSSDKEIILIPSEVGTYEIKCRVIEQFPLHNEAGVHVSNWCSKTISVVEPLRTNDWIAMNPMINSSGTLSFDLCYKSTHNLYRCYALYYVFLYQGAYDGKYNSCEWEWEKALNETYYHPPQIDEELGFVYCDWDYLNDENYILIGNNELYSKVRTISSFPQGKTIDDIEYVIIFVRDNKNGIYSRYSITGEFEYN